MADLALIKTHAGLIPATEADAEAVKKYRLGEVVHGSFKRVRNPKFHRKFFSLLSVGFDAWEPPEREYKGLPVQKNFERFRKDVSISAGYYEVVSNLRGEVRAEAKSMSFASMDEQEFAELYSKVADVILQKILTNYTREDLDDVVENVLRFV